MTLSEMKTFLRQHFWARCVATVVMVLGLPVWIPIVLVVAVFVLAYESLCTLVRK